MSNRHKRHLWRGALVLYTALVYVLLVALSSKIGLLPPSVSDAVESAVPDRLVETTVASALLP